MRPRPLPVTAATILLVLLSLFLLPWEWLSPGVVEEPAAFVSYGALVLGIVGLVGAVGLWMVKKWSFWVSIVVSVLSCLLAAPRVVMAPTAAEKVPPTVAVVVAAAIIVLVVLRDSRRALTTAERPSSRVR
jgi:uncharacterized membrane protein (DUF2068 family)